MSTIHLQSASVLDNLLNGVEQLNTPDLERLANTVMALRARRRSYSLPQQEADLLNKINQGLTPDAQQRFDELTAMRRSGTLTNEDLQELLRLIDDVERQDLKRMECLAELAQLRGVRVRTLMNQLEIRRPAYA